MNRGNSSAFREPVPVVWKKRIASNYECVIMDIGDSICEMIKTILCGTASIAAPYLIHWFVS